MPHPDAQKSRWSWQNDCARAALLKRSSPPSSQPVVLKALLLFEPGVAVTDLTSFKRRQRSGLPQVPLRRVELVVLVSDLTRPIRDAIDYAEALGPPVRTVHIDVDDEQRDKLIGEWATPATGTSSRSSPAPSGR